MAKKKKKEKFTYTKKCVSIILAFAIFNIQLSYVLAFLGREQIAESLSSLIVTEVIGVFFVYAIKSFKETKESEKVRLIEEERAFSNEEEVENEYLD